MIFLDTNIFYNFFFKTNITDKVKKIFLLEEDFCTSFIVLNETIYVICFKYAKEYFEVQDCGNLWKFERIPPVPNPT